MNELRKIMTSAGFFANTSHDIFRHPLATTDVIQLNVPVLKSQFEILFGHYSTTQMGNSRTNTKKGPGWNCEKNKSLIQDLIC